MNAREVLEGMIRTDRGDMTVHSPVEVQARLDAYRTEVLAEAAAEAENTADESFFVPGRVYTRTDRTGLHLRFVCEHLTKDPKVGDREAWGWLLRSDGTRRMLRAWDHDFPLWTPEAGEGRG
ncbi:hypothetical protein F3K34_13165 [Streptomyces sp. LBUM 1486]|uniref:hypothetical protein n=1 Tax=Streptomyces scabiei TaxID=1930 RepID=UPI001B325B0F|nr:hypothetical protein [Streptomyces sp. LBUM 1486]MBP5913184.1 hypothetical protein [Streptomyces sp. LBUM 1486]